MLNLMGLFSLRFLEFCEVFLPFLENYAKFFWLVAFVRYIKLNEF